MRGVLDTSVIIADDQGSSLTTLGAVQTTHAALLIDEKVASVVARIVAEARGAVQRPTVQDSWIAATAAAHKDRDVTRDVGFGRIPGVQVVRV